MRPRQKLATILLFSAAPLLPSCVATEEAAGDEMEMAAVLDEAELVALRTELMETPSTQALAAMDYFRPLCDSEGYPLVGNVATKSVGLQPSQFCTEVRRK
jgi:hypothetical protein